MRKEAEESHEEDMIAECKAAENDLKVSVISFPVLHSIMFWLIKLPLLPECGVCSACP